MAKEITAAPILPAKVQPAESVQSRWLVTAAAGTTRGDILTPEYWSHAAMMLRPFHLIDVQCEDGSFFAQYIVISCDSNWARLYELHYYDLTQVIKLSEKALNKMKEEYIVKHRGPKGWSVIRVGDDALMKEGLQTEAEAGAWIGQLLQKRNAA